MLQDHRMRTSRGIEGDLPGARRGTVSYERPAVERRKVAVRERSGQPPHACTIGKAAPLDACAHSCCRGAIHRRKERERATQIALALDEARELDQNVVDVRRLHGKAMLLARVRQTSG